MQGAVSLDVHGAFWSAVANGSMNAESAADFLSARQTPRSSDVFRDGFFPEQGEPINPGSRC